MSTVLLLNSGGVDSTLLAAYLSMTEGHTVHSLHIDTYQVNRLQTMAAAEITANKFCASHNVLSLNFGQVPNYWEEFYVDPPAEKTMYKDAPNDIWKQTPEAREGERPFQHFHVLPNHTMVIVSIGVAAAKMYNIPEVYTGHRLSVNDQWAASYNEMADQRIHRTTRAMVRMPFRDHISYAEAAELIVGELTPSKIAVIRSHLSETYSCRWDVPCGVCEKCTSRADLGLS